jgi:hypothetical protein
MASSNAQLSSDVTAGLVEVDEQAFVVAWLPFGLLLVGLSIAAVQTDRLPRSMAWSGGLLGFTCMAAVPFSVAEPFVLPWLISLLWLVAASTMLVRRARRSGQPWSVEV